MANWRGFFQFISPFYFIRLDELLGVFLCIQSRAAVPPVIKPQASCKSRLTRPSITELVDFYFLVFPLFIEKDMICPVTGDFAPSDHSELGLAYDSVGDCSTWRNFKGFASPGRNRMWRLTDQVKIYCMIAESRAMQIFLILPFLRL